MIVVIGVVVNDDTVLSDSDIMIMLVGIAISQTQ